MITHVGSIVDKHLDKIRPPVGALVTPTTGCGTTASHGARIFGGFPDQNHQTTNDETMMDDDGWMISDEQRLTGWWLEPL